MMDQGPMGGMGGGPRGHYGMDHNQGYGMGDGYGGGMQHLPSGAAFDAATGSHGGTGGTTILKLRGLPFSVNDDDIVRWFDDASLGVPPPTKDK